MSLPRSSQAIAGGARLWARPSLSLLVSSTVCSPITQSWAELSSVVGDLEE